MWQALGGAGEFLLGISAILSVFGNAWAFYHANKKMDRVVEQTNGVSEHLANTNAQLLAVTGLAERAKGVIEGAQQERDK